MKQAIILELRGMIGGACESIKLLIQNIGHSVDLIIPKREDIYISKRMLKQFYGENVDQIFEFYLPFCLEGTKGGGIFDNDLMRRRYRLFQKHKKELYHFFDVKKYDHIHLNGLGLYPILTKKFPMTIHIRQVFDGNRVKKAIIDNYLLKAKGVVYIDSSTQEPFKNLNVNSLLISNPIDQTEINKIDKSMVMNSYGLDKEDVIFTIAGALSENKGQEFVIQAFNKFSEYPYKLLIAGTGSDADKRRCSELSKENSNILFLGQVSKDEMYKIYSITDYIIRAEAFFTIGRTVYEGLYSGTGLIIQGTEKELLNIKEYNKYKGKIYSYIPRDIQQFKQVLHMIQGKKIYHSRAVSNADNYSKKFNRYIDRVLK